MSSDHPNQHKALGLPEVFSIATGAMISSGLFVLPGVLYAQSGNQIVAAYLLAGLMLIPAMLAKAELATAMPRSGGTYFFVERSLGPLLGCFAGFAGWFSIALKGAFALVGIGAFWKYIDPNASEFTYKMIALSFVVIFTLINLKGTHGSARSQVILVAIMLSILAAYILLGGLKGGQKELAEFIPGNFKGILPITGMVFVSFAGLTKVAAVAHEVKNPGRNLPRGMFLSLAVVMCVYILCIVVTIFLLDSDTLKTTLTPLSDAALVIAGRPAAILLSLAALIAFATTANAAILSASQNPSAMANDGLMPAGMARINRKEVPFNGVLGTSLFMIVVILALDLSNLVKAASTMQLILFLLDNLSLILMRESRIVSYRPLYRAPLYPILPIIGMLISAYMIYSMGAMPLILTSAFFVLTTLWTFLYKRGSTSRDSALFRIVERMAAREVRGTRLSEELGEILRERDDISEDRFDQMIRKAIILDFERRITRGELFEKLASAFTLRLDASHDEVLSKLIARDAESTTLINENLAIPHIVLDDAEEEGFEIVIVRAREGIVYEEGQSEPRIVFALAGSADQRNFHLQCLMAIAQIAQTTDFTNRWDAAFDEEELRLLVLLAERKR